MAISGYASLPRYRLETLHTYTLALEDTLTQSVISARKIDVEHVKIQCAANLKDVKTALETLVSQLDPTVAESLRKGDRDAVKSQQEHGPKLSIFVIRDHGSLLEIVGKPRVAYQYEIGNQITASRMTRHDIRAALYAPLRIILYEDGQGRAVFEYDKPSSLFGQFGDEQVTKVGRELDEELERVLLRAAG
jgi:uncharacterized protein (DUF302 family)